MDRPARYLLAGLLHDYSCYLCCCFLYVGGLWPFWSLHNFEFHCIAFLQCAVPVTNDRRIVDENIRTILAADEAVSLRIVEPFHGSLHLLRPP